MNPSATAAAPRAAHDAPDASPRVPTTYLTAWSTSAQQDYLPTSAPPTTSYYLLPSVAEDAVSIFSFKTAVRRRPLPNGALLARSARGGTLVVPADCHLRAHKRGE